MACLETSTKIPLKNTYPLKYYTCKYQALYKISFEKSLKNDNFRMTTYPSY